jgi:hypothetical protein
MLELRNIGALPSPATRDAARLKASQELFEQIETPFSNDDFVQRRCPGTGQGCGPDHCFGAILVQGSETAQTDRSKIV